MAGQQLAVQGDLDAETVLAALADPSIVLTFPTEDNEAISRRIEAQTLEATSAAELFGGGEDVLHARDMIGRPLQFLSVEWRPSDLEGEGLPFYALVKVADTQGEVRLMSTGARNIVLKLAKAQAAGWLPQWLKVVEVTVKNPVKGRSAPLDVVLVDAPVGDEEPF